MEAKIKEFVTNYIATALWSTSVDDDEDIEFLNEKYNAWDIAQESVDKINEDCVRFLEKASAFLTEENTERAGGDFWLNRNGHGTGFWDNEEIYGEEQAKALSALSEEFGSCDIYVGDDGKLYI